MRVLEHLNFIRFILFNLRLLVGAGQGFLSTTVYTVEIVNKEVRGSISVFEGVSRSFGVILIYSLGSFLKWYQTAYIGMIFPFMAFLLLLILPESPYFLVSVGKIEDATKSLKKLHESTKDLDEELKSIKKSVLEIRELASSDKDGIFKLLKNFHKHPEMYKPFLIVTIMR